MASTYTFEHVEGQGICINYFMESGAGRNRALTCMSGNCIERPLRPLRLQNATLERQNAEFIDNCCEQTNALIEPFRRPPSSGRLVGNWESAGINRHVVGDARALQERK
jgi:hypothetical protein